MRLFVLFITIISFASCMSYQYVTLKTDLPEELNTHRYFTQENNVKISYDFFGSGMPVTSRIYNDSDSGIFVDLQTSVYLLNNQVVARAAGAPKINFQSYSIPSYINDDGTVYSESSGTVSNTADVLFIPPGSYAEVRSRHFKVSYDKTKKQNFTEKEQHVSGGVSHSVKRYDFGEDANTYGIVFRVSHEAQFKEAWNIEAVFEDHILYNFSHQPVIVKNGPAQNYYLSKNHGRDVARVMVGGLVLVGLYGMATTSPVE